MMRVYRCETLLTDARASIRRDMGILVEAGRILSVEPFAELRAEADAVDLPGLVMPGLVDAHTHLRSAPAAAQARLSELSFEQWAYAITALTPLPVFDDAVVAAGELVRSGVTSAQVMVHSWGDAESRLDELSDVVRAAESTGLRALLVAGLTDQAEFSPLDEPAEALGLREPDRDLSPAEWGGFVERARQTVDAASDRITLGVGPVAPQWCSDEALRAVAEHRGELRVHTHLLESPLQRDWLGDGGSPLFRLERAGLLGDFASAAHGVHLTAAELDRLAEARASLVHCPTSNRLLGVGEARVAEWLDRQIDAALGLDSQMLPHPDPFEGMREAIGCGDRAGRGVSATEVLEMATLGGAASLGLAAGAVAEGRLADFIALDLVLAEADDAAEGIVAQAHSGLARNVVIDGEERSPVGDERDRDLSELSESLQRIVDEDAAQRAHRLGALEEPLHTIQKFGGRQR